jgi:hypothetical protein
MKSIIILCVMLALESAHAVRYCIHNGNRTGSCFDNLRICEQFKNNNFRRNDECLKEEVKTNYPPTLSASVPNAFCLWFLHQGKLKKMGCMEKSICEYSMSQKAQTVCAKGSINNMAEIQKLYLANENKVKAKESALNNKKLSYENKIFAKGSADEVAGLVERKYGSLEYKTPEKVKEAQARLEPLCAKDNAKSCYVLYDLYGLSDFKENWGRSASAQCNDRKKSFEYLYRSCALGYYRACNEISNDHESDGSLFIREPNQDGVANDEAKGVDCARPRMPQGVIAMQEKCAELGSSEADSMCFYEKKFNAPMEKLSYEQLVLAGEHARNHKQNAEAISFYKRACELKSGTRPCIDWALEVYDKDIEGGRIVYRNVCNNPKADEEFKSTCNNLARDFMSGE